MLLFPALLLQQLLDLLLLLQLLMVHMLHLLCLLQGQKLSPHAFWGVAPEAALERPDVELLPRRLRELRTGLSRLHAGPARVQIAARGARGLWPGVMRGLDNPGLA